MSFLKIGMNTIWSFILFRELQILSEGLYYQLQKVIEQRDDYVEVNRNIVSNYYLTVKPMLLKVKGTGVKEKTLIVLSFVFH